jgi:hypothetical protein
MPRQAASSASPVDHQLWWNEIFGVVVSLALPSCTAAWPETVAANSHQEIVMRSEPETVTCFPAQSRKLQWVTKTFVALESWSAWPSGLARLSRG